MPDQPVWKEFGEAMKSGDKSSSDVFDARYGKYKDVVIKPGAESSGSPPSSKFDPKPFTK